MKLSSFKARFLAGALSVAAIGGLSVATTSCTTIGLAKSEKDITLEKIPEKPRKKIEKKTEGATITEVKTSQKMGRDRYHVKYEKDGMKYDYEVGESGDEIK
ncbi:hypothetical protein BH09SUM1_BH09SUM1_25820 [soil metagenome]